MTSQIADLTSFTLQFLGENFLHEFKKQASSRSKPSRAVLEALKHSTSLNKSLKSQVQSLRSQLSSKNEENQFLESMIGNLKSEIQFLKKSKEEKIKKLCELQAKLYTKIQLLTNQTCLLKKQVELLKSKHQSDSCLPEQHNLQIDSKFTRILTSQEENTSINENNKLEANFCQPVPLDGSNKFNEYVNFQSKKQENHQTQPSSNIKIECQQIENENKTNYNNSGQQQCEQLSEMLNLRYESNDYIDDQDPLAHESGQFSSLQSISPKITQITSEQQILIDEETDKIQTPTLQRVTSDQANESRFKVFAEQKRVSLTFNKGSEFTFLNLQTRKSIQEGNAKSSKNNIGSDSAKVSIAEKNTLQNNQLDIMEDQTYLDNISGVDFDGLMEDLQKVQNNPNNQTQPLLDAQKDEFFYKTSDYDKSANSSHILKIKPKRTNSQLLSPQKTQITMVEVKHFQALKQEQQVKNSPLRYLVRQKEEQKVRIAVHQPVKYMTVTESYKTIDLNRSNKHIIQNEKDCNKGSEVQIKNSSSLLSRSRCSPKSMMNSKVMMHSNVRRNNRGKTLSPLSIENEVADKDHPSSPSSLHPEGLSGCERIPKSYGLIHSLRNKKPTHYNMNNNSSVIQLQQADSPKGCNDSVLMGNYSTFRKKIEAKMTTNIQPIVTSKNAEQELEEQTDKTDSIFQDN